MNEFFESIIELDVDRQTIDTGEISYNAKDDTKLIEDAKAAFINNIRILYTEVDSRISELMHSCNTIQKDACSPKENYQTTIPALCNNAYQKMNKDEIAIGADEHSDISVTEAVELVYSFLGSPIPFTVKANSDDAAKATDKLMDIKSRQFRVLKSFSALRDAYNETYRKCCDICNITAPGGVAQLDMRYRKFRRFSQIVICKAIALTKCANELEQITAKCCNQKNTLTEATEGIDVSKYISQLNKLIPEIREYYEKYEYKELLTPRKKHIDKMEDYVRGAVQRKYSLKIPIYKVVGNSDHVKSTIKSSFIPGLKKILAKYHNFILLNPDMGFDTDMFIYITLQEPFGNDEPNDSETRKNQDKKELLSEATLSKDEKDALSDDAFGLPEKRAYPLNDEVHIRKAIQFFSFCKPDDKETLAANIVKAVAKGNYIGKITISDNNKSTKYFPDWMKENSGAEFKGTGKTAGVYIGNKRVYALMTESAAPMFDVVDENGKLY